MLLAQRLEGELSVLSHPEIAANTTRLLLKFLISVKFQSLGVYTKWLSPLHDKPSNKDTQKVAADFFRHTKYLPSIYNS